MEIVKNYMIEVKGTIGLILTIISPFLDYFGIIIQVLGGIGGLILLIISIQSKLLEKKQREIEIKKSLEEEPWH